MAARKLEDDVTEETKSRRLTEIVDHQQRHSAIRTAESLGKIVSVLIERESKKDKDEWSGRTEHNNVAVFPKENYNAGDFVDVKITDCTTATLIGEAIGYSKNH